MLCLDGDVVAAGDAGDVVLPRRVTPLSLIVFTRAAIIIVSSSAKT